MAIDWEPIETCPRVPGVNYIFYVIQHALHDNVYVNPPKQYMDCHLVPPEMYRDAYEHLNTVHINYDNWNWYTAEFGNLNPERFTITHWRDKPSDPV